MLKVVLCSALCQALSFVEYDSSFSEEEKQLSKPLKISCKLNNAACKLKLKDYKEAKELCTEVLCIETKTSSKLHSHNMKNIYLC